MVDHPDIQAPNDIDQGDDDTGNRIATNKLAGTIHGTIEVGLLCYFTAAGFGFV